MRTKRLGLIVGLVVGVAVCVAGPGAAAGPTPADRCEARKLKAAAEKAECLLEDEAAEILGQAKNFPKCSDGFAKAFAKAEAKAGPGVCVTEGDTAAVEAQVDACVDRLAAALSSATPPATHLFPATGQTTCWDPADTSVPIATIACAGTGQDGEIQAGADLSYTDNGDGTITDNNTGLMWEKLCDQDPPGATCPAEHDVDTTYTWADAFGKIAALNAGAGFAGHTDWRLPNVKELQSIINYQTFVPAVSSAFNTGCVASCTVLTCSCTAANLYWSSSTCAFGPQFAWDVHFDSGTVFCDGGKGSLFFVRAVRGGL